MHESKLHEDNCFVTLTYETAPDSLVPSHYVDFMKRLRWHFGEGIRFFQCGEYGELFSRPHHHALLFNFDVPDRKFYKESQGKRLYTSRKLEEIWSHGLCMIGDVEFESAAYIARYTLKKVVGPAAEAHYGGRVPEYLTMSRRPGIGRGFVEKYRKEIFRSDSCIVRGSECKPPRFYDNIEESVAPSVMERIKRRRRVEAARSLDNSGSRLIVREAVKESAVNLLRRNLEE